MATFRLHPVNANKLPSGWTVAGLGDEAREVSSGYCCRSCSPYAPLRSTWERTRVECVPPPGVSRAKAMAVTMAIVNGRPLPL